jgi:hypothetical protein
VQLNDIDIPKQVNERRLAALIRDLETEREQSIKEETIVRQQTELEVNKHNPVFSFKYKVTKQGLIKFKVTRIKNNATFLKASADATAAYMVSEAKINYERTIEQVHNEGT